MPGDTLRDNERKLGERWRRNPESLPYPPLLRVRVSAEDGTSGLRGITAADLEFQYPVTVLVGKNGTGKSTLLALAAVAFHSPPNYRVPGLQRPGVATTWTTFRDFFHRGPGDADTTGVKLTWDFPGDESRSLTKKTHKWMHYDRRPQRPVVVLGAGRVVPAIEQRVLRSYFSEGSSSVVAPLSPEALSHVERVLGRPYQEAATLESRGRPYRVRRLAASSRYSSFNMGAGEDAAIELVQNLHEAVEGALVIIEEVELGLHPEAAHRLAEVLIDVAYAKKLQIVCSSHSREFIEGLPKEARVLLERRGGHVECFYRPTTSLAFGSIAGRFDRDVVLYCEDEFAAALIQRALRTPARSRVHLVPVGGKSEIAKAAAAHLRDGQAQRVILSWDGDVTTTDIERYTAVLDASSYRLLDLPGTEAPEAHVVGVVRTSAAGRAALATALPEEPMTVDEVLQRLETIADPHKLMYEAAHYLSLPEATVESAFLQAFAAAAPDEMRKIADCVEAELEAGS